MVVNGVLIRTGNWSPTSCLSVESLVAHDLTTRASFLRRAFLCLALLVFADTFTSRLALKYSRPESSGNSRFPTPFIQQSSSGSLALEPAWESIKPCRIAILSSKPIHYETLESIAALYPVAGLRMPSLMNETSCNPSHLVFDYHVLVLHHRGTSWAEYFESDMIGHEYGDQVVKRTIGNLTLYPRWPPEGILSPIVQYDAYIEASCYCQTDPLSYINWTLADDRRSCVFHEVCPEVVDHPRAYWLSPHHDRYFLPTLLPKTTRSPTRRENVTTAPVNLCVVGDTLRRHWRFLLTFLQSPPVPLSSLPDFRIKIFSFGEYPSLLDGYRNVTSLLRIVKYVDFHQAVSDQCDAMLPLLLKSHTDSYFQLPESRKKLSGTVPLIVAYQIPFVIHEDLLDLYRDHLEQLPVPHFSHTDTLESFSTAMAKLLQTWVVK